MASNHKNTSKQPAQKKTPSKKQLREIIEQEKIAEEEHRTRIREVSAIVLFAFALLLMLAAVVEGNSGWARIHNSVLGIFGLCSYILPVIMAYIAICLSLNKFSRKTLIIRIVEFIFMLILLSSMVFSFIYSGKSDIYSNVLLNEFHAAKTYGGGLFGALLGYPLYHWLGTPGVQITLVVLTVAIIMIIAKITVSDLTKPVKKISETAKEKYYARMGNSTDTDNIDVATVNGKPIKPDFNTEIEKPKSDIFADEKKRSKRKVKEQGSVHGEKTSAFDNIDYNKIFKTKKAMEIEEQLKNKEKNEAAKEEVLGEIEQSLSSDESSQNHNLVYHLPSVSLLSVIKNCDDSDSEYEIRTNADILMNTLKSFGVHAQIAGVTCGPSVTRYDIKPEIGIRISKITGLSKEISLNLSTSEVRIAPVPNKSVIGIEVPNKIKHTVGIRELMDNAEFNRQKSRLTVGLGLDIAGTCNYTDLAKMPHLLIAGTTGSGKSVCLNSMILSILYKAKPNEVKFIMVDPKGVELTVYNGIPHLLVPVVKNPRKASGALQWAVSEMLSRYARFEERRVRNIAGYNRAVANEPDVEPLPQILVIIDELSDLMMVSPHEVEESIIRLAQMGRASGIHLVVATQSPRADVITGLIKANIPSRIALKVSNGLESRIIIDQNGAESLLGNGDMLFMPIGASKPTRIQGCYVDENEINKIVKFIKSQASAEYDDEVVKEMEARAVQEKNKKQDIDTSDVGDDLIPKAIELILDTGTASTSFLQRRLSVGYARGARIIDELEQMGIVGPAEGSKPRKILITKEQWLEKNAVSSDSQLTFADKISDVDFTVDDEDEDF